MLLLRSIRPSTTIGSGEEISTREGAGVDFSGLREYGSTDDARLIDWRSSSRGSRIYMKLFETTTSLRVTALFDQHQGSAFSAHESRSKGDLMRSISSDLIRSGRAYGHTLDILGDPRAESGGIPRSSQLTELLRELLSTHPHDRLILIVSDTLDPLPIELLAPLSVTNDLVLIHTFDAFELSPTSDIILRDGRTAGYLDQRGVEGYRAAFETQRRGVEKEWYRYGSYLLLSTADQHEIRINEWMKRRK